MCYIGYAQFSACVRTGKFRNGSCSSSYRSSCCSFCCKGSSRGLCDRNRLDEKLSSRTNTVQDTDSVTDAHSLTDTDTVTIADTNTFR